MFNSIVYSNQITLWWDKEWDRNYRPEYTVSLNGKVVGKTTKTHFTISGLVPKTEYEISVSGIGSAKIKTGVEKRKLDVTKAPYCAIPDGETLNTLAIQKALDDCKEDECVYIPSGTYISGALTMRENSELYLDSGAILQGSTNPKDYLPKIKSRFEGVETKCYRALINIGELDHDSEPTTKNVIIRGDGTVSGGGKILCDAIIESERERLKEYLEKNAEYVKTCENDRTIPGRARGRLVNISNAENVILSGVTFQYGPAWNIHFVYSKDIITHGCKIISQGVWNGDGWNPDSSKNCTVFDTTFKTHDDAIAIKSGKNPEGNVINRPTENVRIFDCHGRNGIAIGSEMSGGIDGVYIWDCDHSKSYSGLRIKYTKKRGGYIKNVKVKDCAFVDVKCWSVPWNDDGESAKMPPKVENIEIDNVTLTGLSINLTTGSEDYVNPIVLTGVDNGEYYLNNVKIKNVKIVGDNSDVKNIQLKNVKNVTIENIEY